jgi:hypothetical protein
MRFLNMDKFWPILYTSGAMRRGWTCLLFDGYDCYLCECPD